MKRRKLLNFIIWVPFVVAIVFFLIFLRNYLMISGSNAGEVTSIMEVYLLRYRNIAIFSLVIGFILLIIKNIIDYNSLKNYDYNNEQVNVLNTISSRKQVEAKTYSFNEERIVNDLLKNKVINVKFLDSKLENRKMKFVNFDESKNSITLIDLYKDKKGDIYDTRYFTKCNKCNGIISKDAVMCVHCGEAQKELKKKENKTRFNPVNFAVNMIIILLCIIVMILLVNKIKVQRDINISNINGNEIKTVETN